VVQRRAAERQQNRIATVWPNEYRNSETGKVYQPHKDEEAFFVFNDSPKWALLKGGEGAGKSVAGICKTLGRLRRGMSGIMASPNLPHFKKSLWREFRLWCPRDALIPSHRHRLSKDWQPHEAFELVFTNGATLLCGGMDNPASWEGPNVHFGHLDEGRHATAEALKVLDGRIRLAGPNGALAQGWITTTPKKNYLFEYFGPIQDNDKFADFKNNILVVTLPVELNRANLSDGYIETRRHSLTESEARVRMDAEWEDETDTEKFVNIFWWDACYEPLPPLTRNEPGIIALDASKGSENPSMLADTFAVILVTRHPSRRDDVAVRYCGIWQPEPGKLLDYEPIEAEVIRLCSEYSVVEVCYDPTQLNQMAGNLRRKSINAKEFQQGNARLIADKDLQTAIVSRTIVHDGNPLLRQHIDNADIVKTEKDTVRIVKRSPSLKIDAAISLAMARTRCKYYNLG